MGLQRTLSEPDAGAHERLGAAELERDDLLAASHVHRYELAAALCEGARVLDLCCGSGYGSLVLAERAASVHGVDVAAEAIEAARAAAGPATVTFEQADALAFVRALEVGRVDAIVCFEGIEHVPEPGALLDELARLRDGGARLLVSLPNSLGFEEENEFHVTDYGYEEMLAAAERLGGVEILEQRLAEASVLRRAGETGETELRGRLRAGGEDEAAWANHWLLIAGVDAAALDGARLRLSVTAASNQSGYMRQLERANADLRRHNARLARTWLGIHDAGAAVVVKRIDERASAAEESLRHWKGEAGKWEAIADSNDWAFKDAQARLASPRYRAVDAVLGGLRRIPGAALLRRLLRRGS